MTTAAKDHLVKEITADNFEQEVNQHGGKVLVDFYAPWCQPCKMIAPVVAQIATEQPELKVVKVDADNAQELMAKFGIRGIPTLLLIENGEVVNTQVGAASVSQVRAFVE
ncbi:thioredoxin [Thalassomonas haliotis]|uniref:Thioredoxin n=1 Tax=Thalassomonas haliotis TaxID=485448 RepID=A0ABY7VJ15_9GAMM|nr:thioredoxin [Thalassomonas haliotis]WDE12923.1 thioredoxin [Thalassomonas haliotis]